ncbi:hypothetical protein FQR65_LT15456 [Abscondita terminalis]|nr:hypothetical protein FQR65_LT15456 [Abscondita terminalis]
MCEGIAFAELCSFIQLKLKIEEKDYIFKMGDLSKMYRDRLKDILTTSDGIPESHSSRLHIKILNQFPHLKADKLTRPKEEGVLCPPHLMHDVFTVAAYDNLDHNPSSTTSESFISRTSVSLFQTPNNCNQGRSRLFATNFLDVASKVRSAPSLPDSYATVNAVLLLDKTPDLLQYFKIKMVFTLRSLEKMSALENTSSVTQTTESASENVDRNKRIHRSPEISQDYVNPMSSTDDDDDIPTIHFFEKERG